MSSLRLIELRVVISVLMVLPTYNFLSIAPHLLPNLPRLKYNHYLHHHYSRPHSNPLPNPLLIRTHLIILVHLIPHHHCLPLLLYQALLLAFLKCIDIVRKNYLLQVIDFNRALNFGQFSFLNLDELLIS